MIQIENLTKNYGDVCAVDRLNLEIREGEILGLLGPNGAGKTTTMRMLTCYLTPTSGDIRVKDLSVCENPLKIKKLLGYLPESAPLYPDMLVYDFLGYTADIRGIDPENKESRIKELAGLCGLAEVMHKPVGELSKGYKQRVGLAHAMMSDPEILVLDEPTSGLDPNQIAEIRDLIKKIGKQKTVIFSTHILSEAEATCDRIVIINKGKIVADGTTEELRSSEGHGYRIDVTLTLGDIAPVKAAFSSIPDIREVIPLESGAGRIRFALACAGVADLRPAVYEVIRARGWPLLEFVRETRSLETTFRELTKEN